MIGEDLVDEEFVVAGPGVASVVDHGLGGVVVTVEIGVGGVPGELHFLVDELAGLAGDAVGDAPDLGGECAHGGEGGAVAFASDDGSGVAHGSVGELAGLDVSEGFFGA